MMTTRRPTEQDRAIDEEIRALAAGEDCWRFSGLTWFANGFHAGVRFAAAARPAPGGDDELRRAVERAAATVRALYGRWAAEEDTHAPSVVNALLGVLYASGHARRDGTRARLDPAPPEPEPGPDEVERAAARCETAIDQWVAHGADEQATIRELIVAARGLVLAARARRGEGR